MQKPDPALDDAIDTAIDKVRVAENDLVDAIQPEIPPPPAMAARVEHRAEDLHVLAEEGVESVTQE